MLRVQSVSAGWFLAGFLCCLVWQWGSEQPATDQSRQGSEALSFNEQSGRQSEPMPQGDSQPVASPTVTRLTGGPGCGSECTDTLITRLQAAVVDRDMDGLSELLNGIALPVKLSREQRQRILQALGYEISALQELSGSATDRLLPFLDPDMQMELADLMALSAQGALRAEAMDVMLLNRHDPGRLAERVANLLESEQNDDVLIAMLSRLPELDSPGTQDRISNALTGILHNAHRHPSVRFHAAQRLSSLAPDSALLHDTIFTMLNSTGDPQRHNALSLLQRAVEHQRNVGDAFEVELDRIANNRNEPANLRIAALRVLSQYQGGS